MDKNRLRYFFTIVVVFYAIELWLVKNGLFQIGIYLYGFFTIMLFLLDRRFIVSWFVFNIPLLPIISTDYKVFSLVGPHEIIYGISLLYISSVKNDPAKNLNSEQKIAISFAWFLFFVGNYIIIKDITLGLNEDQTQGFTYIFKNLVRAFLYYYSLVLLVKKIYTNDFMKYVIIGIKTTSIILTVSMIYSVQLIYMGANIAKKEYYLSKLGENFRFVGFYSGGDENSAGLFLAGIFGFLLANYLNTGKIKEYLIFLGASFFGVLLSGSRSAFLALILIILVFLIVSKSASLKFYIFILLTAFYFLFATQLNLVISRFFDASASNAIDPKQTGRVFKWIYYTNWILNNPNTFIFGNQIKIPFSYAPHNYFIYILYHSGIVPLIIFVSFLIRLLKKVRIRVSETSLVNIFYIIPIPFILFSVNTFSASIFLLLYLPIGRYFKKNTEIDLV